MAETEVPAGLQHLLEAVAGTEWPQGNPGDLRLMAGHWRDVAGLVESVRDRVRDGAVRVERALAGTTAEAVHAFLIPLETQGGFLDQLHAACLVLAGALDAMAAQIERVHVFIIALVIVLAAEIAGDIAAAPVTFGASLALIAGQQAATRVAILAAVKEAVLNLVAHVAGAMLTQVGAAFLADFVVWCRHKEAGFDTGMLQNAAINGAVGGAVGLVTANAGFVLKKRLGSALGEKVPFARLYDGTAPTTWQEAVKRFGANAPVDAALGSATGVAEAAAQDAATGFSGDEVYGAENGAFTGGRDALHNAINPHGKYSTNPAVYIDKGLSHLFTSRTQPPPPGPVTDAAPPRLPEIQRENWDRWTARVVGESGDERG